MEAKFICMEEPAFVELVEIILKKLRDDEVREAKWVTSSVAMSMLGVRSKTTLQAYRDQGKIRYTQNTKIILYDRESILAFLEANAYNPF